MQLTGWPQTYANRLCEWFVMTINCGNCFSEERNINNDDHCFDHKVQSQGLIILGWGLDWLE